MMGLITIEATDREALVKKLEQLTNLVREGFDDHDEVCGESFAIMKLGDAVLDEDDN